MADPTNRGRPPGFAGRGPARLPGRCHRCGGDAPPEGRDRARLVNQSRRAALRPPALDRAPLGRQPSDPDGSWAGHPPCCVAAAVARISSSSVSASHAPLLPSISTMPGRCPRPDPGQAATSHLRAPVPASDHGCPSRPAGPQHTTGGPGRRGTDGPALEETRALHRGPPDGQGRRDAGPHPGLSAPATRMKERVWPLTGTHAHLAPHHVRPSRNPPDERVWSSRPGRRPPAVPTTGPYAARRAPSRCRGRQYAGTVPGIVALPARTSMAQP